jgi:hypothetical protein
MLVRFVVSDEEGESRGKVPQGHRKEGNYVRKNKNINAYE